jgi:hypothetical protein
VAHGDAADTESEATRVLGRELIAGQERAGERLSVRLDWFYERMR